MLKRIYADNYKSLVNFDISLNNINLFFGVNGSGKSAVFEILRKIKDLAAGEGKASDLFLLDDLHDGNIPRSKPLNCQSMAMVEAMDTN